MMMIIIIIFIYLPSDVISQEKTATSSRSITKASKYAIPLKPNTQTCRVKAIFSHLVRRQQGPKGYLSLLPPHQVKVKKKKQLLDFLSLLLSMIKNFTKN